MAYLTYEEYVAYYPDADEATFKRLDFEAERILDYQTTGIDNVRKLKVAFPTDADDANIVKQCIIRMVNILQTLEELDSVAVGHAVQYGGTVNSVSSGSESISFGSGNGTALLEASKSPEAKAQLLKNTIKLYLSGIEDANGVNLLYMGRYPKCIKTE